MRTSLSDSQTFFTQSRVSHLGLQFPYVDNERTEFQRDLEVCMCILRVGEDITLNIVYCTKCWRRQWHPSPVLLPGKSHGRRSLVGYSPWGRQELDTTERLHFCFSLSCFGEGNGNPLQCSCLENPRDGGAWWAAVYGVTQSWTRLT